MRETIQIRGEATAKLLACALADCGLKIHLVATNQQKAGQKQKAGQNRQAAFALALNRATLDMLAALNIHVQGNPVKKVEVYAAVGPGEIFAPPFSVSADDIDRSDCGKIVLMKNLLEALEKALAERSIEISSSTIPTRHHIICDQPQFEPVIYRQTSLTALIQHEWAHHNIATQFFFKNGPLALLPLPDQQSALVWTQDTQAANDLLSLPEKKALGFLKNHLPQEKQKIKLLSPLSAQPLCFFFARSWFDGQQLKIGSAAHQIHPLAGQGFNICCEDVRLLAQFVQERQNLGLEVFSYTMLEAYQRQRRLHAGAFSHLIDGLARWPLLSNRVAATILDGLAISKNARKILAALGSGLFQEIFLASSSNNIGMPERTG